MIGRLLVLILWLSLPLAAEIGVPQLKGLSQDEAAESLRAAGLRAKVIPVVSQGPPGQILRQDPSPGKRLTGEQAVTLYVSVRPEKSSSTKYSEASPKPLRSRSNMRRYLGLAITEMFFLAGLWAAMRATRPGQAEDSSGIFFEAVHASDG